MEYPCSETLSLPGGPARVQWRRSARARRVSLRIDPRDGAVVVTLPPRAGRTQGMALLTTHADWVAGKLAALPRPVRLADGAVLPIDGVDHRVRHVGAEESRISGRGARGAAWIEAGEIRIGGEPAFLERRLRDFLLAEARRRLGAIVAAKAQAAGVRPKRLSLKDTRSRWGSCAPDGSLALSWRLLMAPRLVQDYVAAHEVAHLRHMNHGPRFWAQVAALTPHTDAAIAWLRANGARLMRVD